MSNIYAVKNKNTGAVVALVRAANKGAALRHIAETSFDAGKAKQDELIAGLQAGLPVQEIVGEAKADEAEAAPATEAAAE
jgi:hypothetical protein